MRSLRDYIVITAAYWALTLTDGALRMLVLLHLHRLGYRPLEIVALFLLYELCGIATNLLGGWLGARRGLKTTLLLGLILQVAACGMLAASAPQLGVMVVLLSQAFSGVAKDLTKMSAKSYLKQLVPAGDLHGLLRWVSLLTGSKNALKGAGFFVGGALLEAVGIAVACQVMAGWLMLALLVAGAALPTATAGAKVRLHWRELLATDPRIRWLSAARLFLFAARDTWFALALPVFLADNLGWSFHRVGAFLAAWVIGYGAIQAMAPLWTSGRRRGPPDAARLGRFAIALGLPLLAMLIGMHQGAPPAATLIIGLGGFALLFASNSAMHSFLVVAYAEQDRVAIQVGFYYMANAAGRFLGTLLSGVAFQAAGAGVDGLLACLAAALALVAVSAALCLPLRAAERRHAGEALPT